MNNETAGGIVSEERAFLLIPILSVVCALLIYCCVWLSLPRRDNIQEIRPSLASKLTRESQHHRHQKETILTTTTTGE